jgi:hypothetical protein
MLPLSDCHHTLEWPLAGHDGSPNSSYKIITPCYLKSPRSDGRGDRSIGEFELAVERGETVGTNVAKLYLQIKIYYYYYKINYL